MNYRRYKRQMKRNFRRNPGMRLRYIAAMRAVFALHPPPRGHIMLKIMNMINAGAK